MSRSARASVESSRRTREPEAASARASLKPIDLAILGAIVIFAAILMARGGSRRGVELMPWPDGVEYAAQAVNIDRGLGPVLHFGGYSYPSRYTEGYPLMLAAAWPLVGHDAARLFLATMAMALIAIAAIYVLALWLFGRMSAVVAAIVLALSPVFLTYSTLVMSDVPTLMVTILAAIALAATSSREEGNDSLDPPGLALWIVFGLLAGFSVMIRPTSATILAGLVVCVALVPPRKLRAIASALVAFGAGFIVPIVVQLCENAIHLGSPFASGYFWWVPEVYGIGGHTFSAAYLFGATMPRNPHGNVPIYVLALLGLDGLLGDRGDLRFFLYPFAAAVFAFTGIVAALRDRSSRATRRVVLFGVGYLGALFALYSVYLFTDVAFILPGAFILFAGAGYGVVIANRWMRSALGDGKGNAIAKTIGAGVIALDVLLAGSLLTEAGARIAPNPSPSAIVPALETLDHTMPPNAVFITNVSLQFFDLYVNGSECDVVPLNYLDPGQHFTDYHLHRLFDKRASGWTGAMPIALFDGEAISKPILDSIQTALAIHRTVLLVLAPPESEDYADALKHQLDALHDRFDIVPIGESPALTVYQLSELSPAK
jgi:4-amino-4-deoxy-L-arabinose transferase-like glycosyltransferase